MKSKTIQKKIISQALVSILLVFIIVTYSWWSYNDAGNELVKNYSSFTHSISANNANKIESEFKGLTLLFEYISDAINKEGINDKVFASPYFKKVYSTIAEDFLIFDESGNILFYDSDEDIFLEPNTLKDVFLETISHEKGLPMPRITEYNNVVIKDKSFGLFFFVNKLTYEPLDKEIYLTFVISGERLYDNYIRDLHLANNGYAYIIDDDQFIITSGVRSQIGKKFDEIEDEELQEILAQNQDKSEKRVQEITRVFEKHRAGKRKIFDKMVVGESGTMSYSSHEGAAVEELLSFAPIRIPGDTWSFAVKTPYTYVTDTFKGSFKRIVSLTTLFILVLFLDFCYIIYHYKKRISAESEVGHLSELYEKEQRLRKAEYRYKQLYQSTKDIILICNPDLTIVEANTAGVDAIGKNIKDITHQMKFSDRFISSDDLKEFISILDKSGNVVNFQTEVMDDDETFSYEISADKQFDDGDRKEYIYFDIRDITGQKRLQQEMIEKEKLESAMALIVTANHEINNPLTGITLNIELLSGLLENEGEKVRTVIDEVSKDAFRISSVLKSLREMEAIKKKEYMADVDMLEIDTEKTD